MSATERKVVHEYLKDREDVETYSEGTEPDRHLVVAPLTSRAFHVKQLAAVAPPHAVEPLERILRAAGDGSDGVDDGARRTTDAIPRHVADSLSALALAVRARRARGSPTSARAPAGPGWRSPPRCRTRPSRSSRARSGTAATSSARSRSSGLANVTRRQRARRGVAGGPRRARPRHRAGARRRCR